jgi:hypothetical protein
MKALSFLMTILFVTSTFASDAVQVADLYSTKVDEYIRLKNEQLVSKGLKPICNGLDERQRELFLENLTVRNQDGSFKGYVNLKITDAEIYMEKIANDLECHPLACPSQARASLAGVVCNGAAYRKDLKLLQGAMSSMNGRKSQDGLPLDSLLKIQIK